MGAIRYTIEQRHLIRNISRFMDINSLTDGDKKAEITYILSYPLCERIYLRGLQEQNHAIAASLRIGEIDKKVIMKRSGDWYSQDCLARLRRGWKSYI